MEIDKRKMKLLKRYKNCKVEIEEEDTPLDEKVQNELKASKKLKLKDQS